MKFYIASDHAGRSIKERMRKTLEKLKIEYEDLSKTNTATDDYPDYAKKVAKAINEKDKYGIVSCGNGIGISIAINKYQGIRAGIINDSLDAKNAREDDHINVIVLRGKKSKHKYTDKELENIIKKFIQAKPKTGKYERRIKKIEKIIK